MVVSETAVEVVTRGFSTLGIGIAIVVTTWLVCRLKDLIFGDEKYGKK